MSDRKLRHAFTLVELVVVVVVLAVLGAASIVGFVALTERTKEDALESSVAVFSKGLQALAAFDIDEGEDSRTWASAATKLVAVDLPAGMSVFAVVADPTPGPAQLTPDVTVDSAVQAFRFERDGIGACAVFGSVEPGPVAGITELRVPRVDIAATDTTFGIAADGTVTPPLEPQDLVAVVVAPSTADAGSGDAGVTTSSCRP